LTFWRNTLIPCADTVYLLSGSVFPYTMPFDLIQTIKSLASPEKRVNWTVVHNNCTVNAYTDTALDHLYEHWLNYNIPYKTELLVPILLRQTVASQIDGIPVMKDYQANMINQPDGHIDVHNISQETAERNRLVAKLKVENITPTQEITLKRWIAWTLLAAEHNWPDHGRKNKQWWDDFTLEDAEKYARGRAFISIIRKIRNAKRKPIIFAYSVFHQQWAAHVLTFYEITKQKGSPATRLQKYSLRCRRRNNSRRKTSYEKEKHPSDGNNTRRNRRRSYIRHPHWSNRS
jgi:hypothetical protein